MAGLAQNNGVDLKHMISLQKKKLKAIKKVTLDDNRELKQLFLLIMKQD